VHDLASAWTNVDERKHWKAANRCVTVFGVPAILNGSTPTLKRTSALITEWSQNCAHPP
jgi:hypothetical protein